MQSLWSTHRRSKLNLNSSPGSTPTAEEPVPVTAPPEVINGDVGPLKAQTEVVDASMASTSASGKRKIRPPRVGEESSKRTKLSNGGIAKDYAAPSARLSDLGGVEDCIEKLLELVAMPLCHPEVYLHTGVQPPRGVLLHGPPGCGKTLLANAMAGVGAFSC